MNECTLLLIRSIMLVVFLMVFGSVLLGSDFIWFIEYETYWAFFFSLFSLIATAKAG